VPVSIEEFAAPPHTALLIMEMQRGVAGDLSKFPDLAAAVAAGGVIGNAARLAEAARRARVPVVHCTAAFRADRKGSHTANCPFIRVLLADSDHMLDGSQAAQIIGALGPAPTDLQSRRYHGFSPFTGTSLDMTLRSMGVRTVVAAGVSLNLGIPGLCLEAVNLGYRVAVATDAVAGFPAEYAQAVLDNTVSLLAARVPVADLIAAWNSAAASP
jgi:nicotinamidase-related amidase